MKIKAKFDGEVTFELVPDDPPEPPVPTEWAMGFGEAARGGKNRYVVTTLKDGGPGSLRHACRQPGRHIVFDVDGKIRQKQVLDVPNRTYLDCRGRNIQIVGEGVRVKDRRDVVIRNVEITDVRDDCLWIAGSEHVWIDHVSLARAGDGGLDVTDASRYVTISNSHFADINKFGLLGNSNDKVLDKRMRTSVYGCHFDSNQQRQFMCRFGWLHMWNNLHVNWGRGSTGGQNVVSVHDAQVYLEKNVYLANRNKQAVRVESGDFIPTKGNVKTLDNLLLNGARDMQRNPERVFDPRKGYDYTVQDADLDLMIDVLIHAGVQPPDYWQD